MALLLLDGRKFKKAASPQKFKRETGKVAAKHQLYLSRPEKQLNQNKVERCAFLFLILFFEYFAKPKLLGFRINAFFLKGRFVLSFMG